MNRYKWLPLLFLIIIFISCQKETGVITHPSGTNTDTVFKDVRYGNDQKQVFDLYLPAGRTDTTPVIILIHGGGWSSGDKNELAFFGENFQKNGFAVANINYRLSPAADDNFKMQLDDIGAVVAYLQNSSTKYVYSKNRLYTIGHSAGAHLSLSYAYTRNNSHTIKAAAGMATPTNLFSMAYYNPVVYGEMLTSYLGAPLSAATETRYKSASPYYQVSSSSVPTILFQGDLDIVVNKEQATSISGKLTGIGVANKLIIYPFIFHDWWTNGDLVANTVAESAKWFNQYR